MRVQSLGTEKGKMGDVWLPNAPITGQVDKLLVWLQSWLSGITVSRNDVLLVSASDR